MSAVVKTTEVAFDTSETTPDRIAPAYQPPEPPVLKAESLYALSVLHQNAMNVLAKKDITRQNREHFFDPISALLEKKDFYLRTAANIENIRSNLSEFDGAAQSSRKWLQDCIDTYVQELHDTSCSAVPTNEFALYVRRINYGIEDCFAPDVGTSKEGIKNVLAGIRELRERIYPVRARSIYSDSENAMLWVEAGKAKTKLERRAETEEVWKLIGRAEAWLKSNEYKTKIIKWRTEKWGEIPADFGRK